MKIKVGVIFGGETTEHEVSIISAVQAMNNLNEEKYEVIPIYITKDKIWYTGKLLNDISIYRDLDLLKRYAKKVVLCKKEDGYFLQTTSGLFKRNITDLDVVLPIVHGNNVEDGSLSGFLETVGIPYASSHVLGSALGQDKVVMKQVMKSSSIPIVDYTWFYDIEYYDNKEKILENIKNLKYPVVVKPATLGSSIGITYVSDEADIQKAIEEAILYDNKIVVEHAIQNVVEVNCSVLGDYEYQKTSVIEEVISNNNVLTYTDKYIGGSKGGKSKGMASTDRIIPARIDEKIEMQIKDLSKNVFKTLNLSGICRIDYLIDNKNKKVYVNEPNTIPGSLSFYLWEPLGVSYSQLLDELITIAIKDYKRRSKKIYSFETNILGNFNGTKGLKGIKGLKR